MKPTIGVSGSAAGNITDELEKKSFVIGEEIAKTGAILITGACTGLSYEAVKGAKSKKGFVVGISPAGTRTEHKEKYQFPEEAFDLIVYTGFGYKGRNIIFIRSCDAVICIAGRTGTLNEFTIAYDEGRPLGILQPGGISELLPRLEKISGKGKAPVIYETNPKKLVQKLTVSL